MSKGREKYQGTANIFHSITESQYNFATYVKPFMKKLWCNRKRNVKFKDIFCPWRLNQRPQATSHYPPKIMLLSPAQKQVANDKKEWQTVKRNKRKSFSTNVLKKAYKCLRRKIQTMFRILLECVINFLIWKNIIPPAQIKYNKIVH